jgi:hypothetical protein
MKITISYSFVLIGAFLFVPLCSFADRFEEAPIIYSDTEADNPISVLQEAIDAESVALEYDEQFGYLKSLLDALNIPLASQMLVFSKTSFQNRYITPETPRAIYYSDDVYIGTVPRGDVLEVSVSDVELGTVFYVLAQEKSARPEFIRQNNNCLQCHASTLTRGVPGHVVRSVFPDKEGFPILKAGTHVTTQNSPLKERWGGWYVTGTHGDARHMGNAIAQELERDAVVDMEAGANRTSLDARVDVSKYLTPHSDIVALMVLEHQTKMHNLLTGLSFETRMALKDQAVMDEIFDRDASELSASTKSRIENVGSALVDEAVLTAPIAGTSGFSEGFAGQGPTDRIGRSLRTLDLESRLFKYPMSYLIYSPQFEGLPDEAKAYVYGRLWAILSGEVRDADYAHLTRRTRRAIQEILMDTKDDLPDYWGKV